MHTCDNSTVPAFLIKLWKLVEDDECNDLITWNDSGNTFIIRNPTRFAKELLPQYFKHSNMASFIRQLNMYGFRKVVNYEKTGLRCENDEMEFQHSSFLKGPGARLDHIKRKIPNAKNEPTTVRSNAKTILTDLTTIREKQENMDSMLLKMKQENELLWRELTSMRQKHKAQEQIIQKVIQFLVSIVQRSNQNIGVKRKIPRMIHDSLESKGKANQVARHLNVLRKSASDRFITVPQDKVISPLGPVIHEVTDFDHDDPDEPNEAVNIQSPQESSAVSSPVSTSVNDIECPLNSSINSPINTLDTMEPLSILEPLASANGPITEICIEPATMECVTEEEILGLPLYYPSANVISIPEDILPENDDVDDPRSLTMPGTSSALSSLVLPSPISISSPVREEIIYTESLQTPKIDIGRDSPPKFISTALAKNKEEPKVKDKNKYQIAVSDSSLVKSNSLAKNSLSSHILDVEEELKWLQDQISSNAWNIDASKLLGVCQPWDKWTSFDAQLFSTDDMVNNEHLAEQFTNETSKIEKNDIIGNELVQFTPSMLQLDEFEVDNPPLMDYLDQMNKYDLEDIPSMNADDELSCGNTDLDLLQVLCGSNDIDQKPVIIESVLKPQEVSKRTSPKRPANSQRRKRLKAN